MLPKPIWILALRNETLELWLPFAPLHLVWNIKGLKTVWESWHEGDLHTGQWESVLEDLVRQGYVRRSQHLNSIVWLNPLFSLRLKAFWKSKNSTVQEEVLRLLHRHYYLYGYGILKLFREEGEEGYWLRQLQLEKATLIHLWLNALRRGKSYNYLPVLSRYFDSSKDWIQFHHVLQRAQEAIKFDSLELQPFFFQMEVGELMLTHGNVLQELQQPQAAIEKFEQGLQLYSRLDQAYEMAAVLNSMGTAYQMAQDWTQAVNAYEKTLEILSDIIERELIQETEEPSLSWQPWYSRYERESPYLRQAQTQENLGALYTLLRKYSPAEHYLQLALEGYSRFKYKEKLAGLYHNLGLLHTETQQVSEGIGWLRQALETYQELHQIHPQGRVYLELGNAFAEEEEYNAAMMMYQMAMNIFVPLKDFYMQAKVRQSMGWVCLKLTKWEEARDYLSLALATFDNFGDQLAMAEVSHSLGALLLFLGEHLEAKEMTLKAMELYREVGDEAMYQLARENLMANPISEEE